MTFIELYKLIGEYERLKKKLIDLNSFNFKSDHFDDSFEMERRLSEHNQLIGQVKNSITDLENKEIK